MSGGKLRYTPNFKLEAVKQVTERGHSAAEVTNRLAVSAHSLYSWFRAYQNAARSTGRPAVAIEELRRLKAELKRVTEERDILTKAATYFAK